MDDAARDGLAGPIGYDPWWGILGGALLLLALAWTLALVFAARRARRRAERARADALPTLRRTYAVQVDDIERSLASSELAPREAALQLTAIARAWVAETTGGERGDLHAATALELHQRGFDPLAGTVATSYPTAFGRDPGDVERLLAEVRELLRP